MQTDNASAVVTVTQLPDPNDPRYERARLAMAGHLFAIGREEPASGFGRMADELMCGDLMQVPTWIALGMLAQSESTARVEALEKALQAIVAAQLLGDDGFYRGWSITGLNAVIDDVRAALGMGPTPLDPQTKAMIERVRANPGAFTIPPLHVEGAGS
jgi:hypothetical protein